MKIKQNHELDALYIAWNEESETPTQNAPSRLREWTGRYPDYASELTQWATAAPVCDTITNAGVNAEIIEGEARTRAIGQRVVAEMRARYLATASTPLNSLLDAAKQQGLSARALAERLQVGMPLVAKLNQRLLIVASLPETLIVRLAECLATGTQQVRAYLQQPPTLAAAASYKSSGVPQTAEPEEFTQAVRTCADMTLEQKQFWLNAPSNN